MTQYPTGAGDASATEQVKEQVQEKAQAAKEQVREKAQVAQDQARGAAQQARSRLRDQVDQRSTQAGERLSGAAADARSVAEELRRQGKHGPAGMVDQVAGQADRWADYLKGASGERVLRDVEDFARSKPWAVAAGGLVLGFAASRMLKASASRRYRQTAGGGWTDDFDTYRVPEHDASPYTAATEELGVAEEVPLTGGYQQVPPAATTRVPVTDYGASAEPEPRLPRAE